MTSRSGGGITSKNVVHKLVHTGVGDNGDRRGAISKPASACRSKVRTRQVRHQRFRH